jgi:hypothetical protein
MWSERKQERWSTSEVSGRVHRYREVRLGYEQHGEDRETALIEDIKRRTAKNLTYKLVLEFKNHYSDNGVFNYYRLLY